MRNIIRIALIVMASWLLMSSANALASIYGGSSHQGYVLPFADGSFKLLQGYNGPYGHTGHAEFAYDFQMPIGTTVIASRSGEVVSVVEKNSDGTRKPGEENVVVVRHSDGTFARYYHLTKDGALVSVGAKVKQGDKIGLSGNSGASAGAHLHFDVTKTCYEWGCQTIEIEFSNAKENPLKAGETYAPESSRPTAY